MRYHESTDDSSLVSYNEYEHFDEEIWSSYEKDQGISELEGTVACEDEPVEEGKVHHG